jgi:hypothetical protein
MALAFVVLDTHIKYSVYVYSPPSATDPADTAREQLHLLLHILLLSAAEHIVFASAFVAAVYAPGGWPRHKGGGARGVPIRRLLQCVLYPNFGRLLVLFVMIWDQQVIVANIIYVLVLTSQCLALEAALGPEEGKGVGDELWAPQARAVVPVLVGLACRFAVRLTVYLVSPSCATLALL